MSDLTATAGRATPRTQRGKDKPLYQIMKKDLEQAIYTGRFEPGSRVPSESELIAHYQVSSTTARRCLDELESDGLLYRVRGKGTFVSELAAILQHRQVSVLVKDLFSLSHPFIAQVLGAIERVTEGSRAHLSVQRIPSLPDAEAMGRTLVSGLRHHRTEFALLLSNVPLAAIQPLLQAGIHCLGVNTRYQDDRIPHLAVDFEAILVKAVRTIARLGHERIAFFVMEPPMAASGVLNSSSFVESGWAKVKAEIPELPEKADIRFIPDTTGESLLRLLEETMTGPTPPTAIICWDEVVGLEVVRLLRKLGFDVPGDVSVLGTKLLPSSELAVVETPLLEMAAASARALLGWVTDGTRPANRLFLPGELLPRETLAPPPSRPA